MKHLYKALIALTLSCSGLSTAIAQSTLAKEVWSASDNDRRIEIQKEEEIEISSNDGVIYIRTPRKVEVTIYTILGQAVITRTINPGISELKIGTRGIYLVKIEGKTQKVAL